MNRSGKHEPPTTILVDGQRFERGDLLGSGKTGEVYAAQGERGEAAVIKFLRERSPSNMDAFSREATILRSWQESYRGALDDDPDKARKRELARFVPRFYGASLNGMDVYDVYLVMEMIPGIQVPKWLEGREYPLQEAQVVRIGYQFAQLLDALHSDPSFLRTFKDMKLENIWWLENQQNSASSHIMVTDWNVLSEQGDLGDLPNDLLRWGDMMFQMLTGATLEFSGRPLASGFTRAEMERWGRTSWHGASVGLQHILNTLFHPVPSERYATAKTLATDLALLDYAWHTSAAALFRELPPMVYGNDNRQKTTAYWYADVLNRRADEAVDPNKLAGILSDIRQGFDTTSALGAGATFIRGKGRDQAEERANFIIANSSNPIDGYRLLALARLATQQSAGTQELLVGKNGIGGILSLFLVRDYASILTSLDTVAPQLKQAEERDALSLLQADARFGLEMYQVEQASERREYAQAQSHLEEAQRAFEPLRRAHAPYARELIRSYGDPLAQMGMIKEQIEKQRQQVQHHQATASGDAETLRRSIALAPNDIVLQRALLKAGITTLTAYPNSLDPVRSLLAIVPLCEFPEPDLLTWYRAVVPLLKAEDSQDKATLESLITNSFALTAGNALLRQALHPHIARQATTMIMALQIAPLSSADLQLLHERHRQQATHWQVTDDYNVRNALNALKDNATRRKAEEDQRVMVLEEQRREEERKAQEHTRRLNESALEEQRARERLNFNRKQYLEKVMEWYQVLLDDGTLLIEPDAYYQEKPSLGMGSATSDFSPYNDRSYE